MRHGYMGQREAKNPPPAPVAQDRATPPPLLNEPLCIHPHGPRPDNAVFVDDYHIESGGVIAQLWSDDARRSHARCACGWHVTVSDAREAMPAWRGHLVDTHAIDRFR